MKNRRSKLYLLLILTVTLCFTLFPEAQGNTFHRIKPQKIKQAEYHLKKINPIFAIPDAIKTEVNFWKDIYTKYDKTKVVVHDKRDLGTIYAVIDVSKIVNNSKLSEDEIRQQKSDYVDAELAKIAADLRAKGDKEAANHVRSQTGIKDKFEEGIKISGRYMSQMEKIFKEEGIPVEITRLAFVESMFNLKALSKVGASGIWQFMPSTGRLFVTINKYVDERNDPIEATRAAAGHLKRDYNYVGTWPLAINSYNSGRGRLERAVAVLGTKDIAKIIKNYDAGGYSFASKNFYPCFLAVLYSFEEREKYFGNITMEEPLEYDTITSNIAVSFPELARAAGTSLDEMLILNPQLQEEVQSGTVLLPAGFSVRIPMGSMEKFAAAFGSTKTSLAKE